MTDRPTTIPTFEFTRAAGAFRTMAAQSRNPAARFALVLFLLILAIPIVLFILFAATVAILAFAVLSLAQRLRDSIHRLFTRPGGAIITRASDGRENVRVIERMD